MKRNSMGFLICLTILFSCGSIFADLVAPAISISGENGGIELSPVALSPGANTAFKTWGPEEKRKQSFEVYLPMKSNEWSNGWVSFKAAKDGMLNISVSGSYKVVNGKKQRINVLFDDITVEGGTIKNGNFESAKGKLPADWYPSSQDENGPRYLAGRGVNGSACVMTWHGGGFSQPIPCVKDAVVTIKLSGKLADADDEKAPVIIGVPAKGSEPVDKGDRIVFSANTEWKAVDMSDVQVKSGSALDLTDINEAGPAGKHGRLMVSKNGQLVFEDSQDVARRFNGFNGFFVTFNVLDDSNKNVVQQRFVELAKLIKRQGSNIVRPLALDGYLMKGAKKDTEFNPDKLDNVDRLISELKTNGVYTYLDIAAYNLGLSTPGKGWQEISNDKVKLFLGDPETRARWQTIAEKLLNHVNPYTKIAWKDEPAIACITFFNEQEFSRCGWGSWLKKPAFLELCQTKWREWLLQKYQTPAGVAAAWNKPDIATSFNSLGVPKNFWAVDKEATDFGTFLAELTRAEMAWYEGIVRTAGYKGLIAQLDVSTEILNSAVRWETSEVVSIHSYFAHSTYGSELPAKIIQESSIGKSANYFRDCNATRLADRPVMVTEYHHFFWNQYQHEGGLVFASYAALQGHAGLFQHEDPVALEVKKTNFMDWIASNPVARANCFITALLYQRGDVKTAAHQVQMQISSAYLNSNNNSIKAVNTDQSKIALMTGFSIAFPELTRPSTLKSVIPKPDLAILPDSGAKVISGEWASSVADSKNSKFSLQEFVGTLKDKGILPPSNLSNPDAGVFQSDTAEITMRSKENLMKVITPKTEGVSLEANKAENLSCLNVEKSTIPAAIVVSAMDNQPLVSSSRMALIYNTEMAFTGMEISQDRKTKFNHGKFPVLLRTGKLNASIKCSNASKLALYALKIDGTRGEKLPVIADGGTLKITIDTATLKNGPTPFFELAAE